jgi:DNA polymerase III alpha subunit
LTLADSRKLAVSNKIDPETATDRYWELEFAAALLNAQPMGFYAPAQIVRDAIEHNIKTLPVDVKLSFWDIAGAKRDKLRADAAAWF